MKKKISIEGMSCGHCVRHVTEALNELGGVSSIDVSLEGKYALIDSEESVTEEDIKAAVEEAGYEVTGIEAL